MDRYTDFIEKMRGSHPQMPHPEEVTGRILERIQALPQHDCKTVTALQKTPVIRVRTDISSLNMRTYAAMSRPDAQLEHYRRIKALKQSVTGLEDRVAKPQDHENRH